MRNLVKIAIVSCISVSSFGLFAQDNTDSTGLAGDHFDLQGAMELFKSATSIELFEQALNTESNQVNNLDLDGDDAIDFIQVVDRVDGTNHAIVLQIAVNESETQDVAVIMIEQTKDSTAQLQIIGNETLYGEEIIMEPYDEVSETAPKGPSSMYGPMRIVVVNVWGWPAVRHIYRPAYKPYISPWKWRSHPVWWKPWRPAMWRVHHARVRRYHVMYHVTPVCHLKHSKSIYVKNKSVSKTVTVKYATPQANYKAKKQVANQQKGGNGNGNGKGNGNGNGNGNNKVEKKATSDKQVQNKQKSNSGTKSSTPAKKGGAKAGGSKRR